MARPRNLTPPLRWHKRTNQFCVYINRSRYVLGADREQADRKRLRLIAAQLGRPQATKPLQCVNDLTVAESLQCYLEFALRHYRDARAHARIRCAVGAAAIHGSTLIANFDGTALREIRDALLLRDPPLSRRYINHLITAIKTSITWMVERKLCPATVLAEVRIVKRLEFGGAELNVQKSPPVDPEVVKRTLPFCAPPVQAMIEIQRMTGMRSGEVIIMRRCDISTSPSQRIQVPNWTRPVNVIEVDGETIWMYVPMTHKNLWRGKTRIIAIPPAARNILAPILLAREPDEFLFRPIDA